MDLTHLIELDRIAKENGHMYPHQRKLFEELVQNTGKHFLGIIGPRGVGKTILLKQLANYYPNSFYISMDTFEGNLFDTVKHLHDVMQVKNFFLDEVHTYKDFNKEIKKIYDVFENKQLRIVLTSSTALGMERSKFDLSRRLLLKKLYPFSFSEYLYFKHGIRAELLSWKDLLTQPLSAHQMRYSEYFYSYLKGGLMPFSLQEQEILPLLKNILETIIYKDIPGIETLTTEELKIIEQLVKFIALSSVDGINYSTLSNNLKITKYKAEQYLSLLERAFVVQRVFPKGSNVMREPKVLLALPYRLLYRAFEESIGALREEFFVFSCTLEGLPVHYLKSTRGTKTADYVVSDEESAVFEIGGKGKGRSQFKGLTVEKKIILADSIETNQADKKPLFSLGLLKTEKLY
ncbi:MAG: ATP-binding protein [Elusimicrobiaceae bacterium]|nr:ATP-binding protein [Elusimicrobiaceae bacterium]